MADMSAMALSSQHQAMPVPDGRRRLERHKRRVHAAVLQAVGGTDYASPQQVIAIRQLAQASALREALFARVVEGIATPDAEAISAFVSLAATETRALKLLGMKRIAKPAESLAAYMARRAAESATPPESTTPAITTPVVAEAGGAVDP